MTPTVSVVVSTHNRSKLLPQAMNSVLAQEFADFELIVVDDGSTDETAGVVTSFNDQRIRYVYQDNAGLSAGRNRGILESRGHYIAFLDDDDLYLPGKLGDQVAFMKANSAIGWSASGHAITDIDGQTLMLWCPWQDHIALDTVAWLFDCPTCPAAVMVDRDWMERIGGFNSANEVIEDWDAWLRLSYAGCHMAWLPIVACQYRVHSTNMTNSVLNYRRRWLALLDRFFDQAGLPEHLLELKNRAYARGHLSMACRAFTVGLGYEGQADLSNAIRCAPELLANNGQEILSALCAHASIPLNVNGDAMMENALRYLPNELASLPRIRERAKATLAMSRLNTICEPRESELMRNLLYQALRNDLSLIYQRHFLVLALTSIVGQDATEKVRSIYRLVISAL